MASSKRPLADVSDGENSDGMRKPQRRWPTVYDAVAGRVSSRGFGVHIADSNARPKNPLRPDEVLYKAPNAPPRYEETDHYFAHTRLPPDQKLPSSELLGALHRWVSNYYDRTSTPSNRNVWQCMDETALIALGILLEETARETLGETGDLAFTEAMDESEDGQSHTGGVQREKETVETSGKAKGKQEVAFEADEDLDDDSNSAWSEDGADSSE